MCGITGILSLDSNPINKELLKSMTDLIRHRGPDGSGYYTDRNIGLGHRRLAIIDLSKKGKQPMSNEDSSIWITFNGEIYNFKELRSELEEKGHRFNSDTDTEVVIHAYEENGEDCVKYLRGMFAFAIWDANNKKLFLARDRIGKKPLFYYYDKNRFIFASELKSLLCDDEIPRQINMLSLSHYLSYGCTPHPNTIFENIHKLSPASTLTVNKQGDIEIKKYWELSFKEKEISEKTACSRILNELEESIKLRMRSDVPIGAFLSGGIDSSAVIAMIAKNSSRPIKTFTIGFEEKEYDESKYAKRIAEKFNTDHTEFLVTPDIVKILPKIVEIYSEPFSNPCASALFYLAKQVSRHVKVVLSGDGGDEAFSGYGRYSTIRFAERCAKLPISMRKLLIGSCCKINWKPIKKIRAVGELSILPNEERCAYSVSEYFGKSKELLITSKLLANQKKLILAREISRVNIKSFNKLLHLDYQRYLPDNILTNVDIATMSNSLEARSPFLDHKLVEFCATLPFSMKVRGFNNKKYILKKALLPILPKNILKKRKQGFSLPIDHWIRTDLKTLSYDLLLSRTSLERGYFNRDFIKKILEDHINKKTNYSLKIWNLLCLELWHRIYIDNDKKLKV